MFVQTGARVGTVRNDGPVTTLGPNDMALDDWGEVTQWTTAAPVTTRGPSGIGFVNFGTLARFEMNTALVTDGTGARGFNLYDGSLDEAVFHSSATHADAAIGIHLPLADATVDTVFAAGLLNHLHDPRAGLRELARITRPTARLAIFHPSALAARST